MPSSARGLCLIDEEKTLDRGSVISKGGGMGLGRFACAAGMGFFAGVAGTAAMTLSQWLEMEFVGRKPDKTPAKVVENVFAVEPADESSEGLLARLGHWAYGIAWGGFRGLLAVSGMRPWLAGVVHFSALEGAASLITASLNMDSPKSGNLNKRIIEAGHHLIYVIVAGMAFEYLRRDVKRGK